jgi:predicted AAA+ superfamily ATPase
MPDTSTRNSKLMELVMYIALRPSQQASYSELYHEFVVKRGWSKSTLNAYLTILRKYRHAITATWVKYVDAGKEKRFRVYRLNQEYFKYGR